MSNIAVVIAGGAGSRMGQDIPKQFIHVENKPIIIYTLEVLEKHPEIDKIICVCKEGWECILASYAKQFNITKLADIVLGGNTRYDSIRAGFEKLENIEDNDVIIIHDAVRPLVPEKSISDVISVCKINHNSMAVIDCVDTMYARTNTGYTEKNVDRSKLVHGQTPEAVSGRRMLEMYAFAEKNGIKNDSISALQVELGWPIHFAHGSERNIKLTRKEDIELFKAMLLIKEDDWLK